MAKRWPTAAQHRWPPFRPVCIRREKVHAVVTQQAVGAYLCRRSKLTGHAHRGYLGQHAICDKFRHNPRIPLNLDVALRMRQNGIPFATNEDAIHHPKVLELYKDLMNSFNKYFNQVEQVKRFELLPHEWTIDSGELTPTLKLKRKVIMEKYKEVLDRIYH